jgi:hypothetical protein
VTRPADTSTPTHSTQSKRTTFSLRSAEDELRAYAHRRIESLERAEPVEAARIEDAMQRALQLLAEAEVDDDPA